MAVSLQILDGKMIQDHQLSERHACRLVGLSRDSYRNLPQPDQLTRDLCERIVDIAHVRRRFGYRRIHDLLRPEFPQVNHKRVYRLYRDANLAVCRRKKAKRPLSERVPLQLWPKPSTRCGAWTLFQIACLTGAESNASRWPMTLAMSAWTSLSTMASQANT